MANEMTSGVKIGPCDPTSLVSPDGLRTVVVREHPALKRLQELGWKEVETEQTPVPKHTKKKKAAARRGSKKKVVRKTRARK